MTLLTGKRWTAAIAGIAITAGVVTANNPSLGVVFTLSILAVPLLLQSSAARFAAVLLGAMVVFQSTQGVGPAKYAYIALVGFCMAVSAVRVWTTQEPAVDAFRPLVPATVILAVIIALSLAVARANGVPLEYWTRDVLPYGLLVALPVIGIDASLDLSPRLLEGIIGLVGVVGALSVALDWLNRRHVSGLGVGRVLLSTTTLVALGFALAITRAGLGPRRATWLLAALTILVAMLLTGSRTNIVLLVGFIGVMGAARKARISLVKGTRLIVAIAAAAMLLLPWAAAKLIDNPHFLAARIHSAKLILTGQAAADQSYEARHLAYTWVARQFQLHPLLGTGPGYRYPNGQFTLDAPQLVLAEFGIVGGAALVLFLVMLAISMHRSRQITGYQAVYTAARGWAIILAALVPFGPWLEDKGFALAVTVLVAAVAARARVAGLGMVQALPHENRPSHPLRN